MCGRAFSEYDLHRHTSGPRRSLFEWLRELWRPRQPQERRKRRSYRSPPRQSSRAAHEADRKDARAA